MVTERAREGHRRRATRRRKALEAQGIKSLTILLPEEAHPPIKDAAARIRAGEDPAAALRGAGGDNQVEQDRRLAKDLAEAESQLSDAGELIDRLYRVRATWKGRAEKAESEVERIRKMPGLLPLIARSILKIQKPN